MLGRRQLNLSSFRTPFIQDDVSINSVSCYGKVFAAKCIEFLYVCIAVSCCHFSENWAIIKFEHLKLIIDKGKTMGISAFKIIYITVIASLLMVLAGCTSAENKAHKSQTEMNERKMEIAENYEKCIQKSTTEEEQAKCEALLKGAEALQ
jgi:hypothetical protein